MFFFYAFLVVIVLCIFFAIKKQRPILLSVPIFALAFYVIVEIALVPGSFIDTVKFIFTLQ